MKLRCTYSKTPNYKVGEEYKSHNERIAGKKVAFIRGVYADFIMEVRPIQAINRGGEKVAEFEIVR